VILFRARAVAPLSRAGRGLKPPSRKLPRAASGCRPALTSGARIETVIHGYAAGINAVAPLSRAGRGLKHEGRRRRRDHPRVAPLSRAGRGLKHVRLRDEQCGGSRPALTSGARIETLDDKEGHVRRAVAPLSRAGRGLKQLASALMRLATVSPRSHERGAD